jgi:hypothetical protein
MDETVPTRRGAGYWTKVQSSEKIPPMPDEPDELCAHCGKSVEPVPDVQVHEGEKRFHLACYLRSRSQASPPERPTSN